MKNALILHGTNGDSTGNWFQWLKSELEKIGYQVETPNLQDSFQPDMDKYWQAVKDFNFNEETLLIGHSSGATTVFGILNRISVKVKMAISVSGFCKYENYNCQNLIKEPFNWERIKNNAQNFLILWSPDDPYIAKDQTDYLSEKLEVKPIIFQNKGHFNLEKSPDFKQFPELLELIKNNL
jgi:hypothetical protein